METSAVCVLTGHNHYYERTKPLDGVTYLVSGGGTANQYATESPDARTAKFVSGRSHYGLVDEFADHLAVRIVDLEGAMFDEFDLPVRPANIGNGRHEAAWSRELPAIATLEHFKAPMELSQAVHVTGAHETTAGIKPAPRTATRAMPGAW